MAQIRPYLVIAELVISFLLMAGVLLQTPKATGLGGTIGGGTCRMELINSNGSITIEKE